MKNINWVIYCHLNTVTGKRYIGLTRNSIARRSGKGTGYSKQGQPVFAKAIAKYGWGAFKSSILEDGIKTLEKAKEREQYWIAYYHTYIYDNDSKGYNMTRGGDNSGSMNYVIIVKDAEIKRITINELDTYIKLGWHKTKKNETWNLQHKDKLKQDQDEYRLTHKQQHYLRNKKYNEEHKEEIAQYMKRWRKAHKAQQKQYMKDYHRAHPDTRDRREYYKQYYLTHKKLNNNRD